MTKLQELKKQLENNEITKEEFKKQFTMKMFFEEIKEGVINEIIIEKASEEIEKINKANEKRKCQGSKKRNKNIEFLNELFEKKFISGTAKDISEILNVSTQKASAIARVGIEENLLTRKDGKNKSAPKIYSTITEEEEKEEE